VIPYKAITVVSVILVIAMLILLRIRKAIQREQRAKGREQS